jgi:hypothetical protein
VTTRRPQAQPINRTAVACSTGTVRVSVNTDLHWSYLTVYGEGNTATATMLPEELEAISAACLSIAGRQRQLIAEAEARRAERKKS